jgi:hypothetical protein
MQRGPMIVTILVGTAVAAASVVTAAGLVFDRQVDRDIAHLFSRAEGVRPTVLTEADLADLPAPVQRWLRRAGVVGRERPVTVRLKMTGEFRLQADGAWMPMEATEYYSTDPPGFVWSARITMAPLVAFLVRDTYLDGHGSMEGRLLGLIPVVKADGPSIDQGALLRYLNETMWFPAGAVHPAIAWEGLDATTARATMTYGDISADATFYFSEEGDLVDMRAERYFQAGDRQELWATPVTEYGEFDGIRIPVAGEGVWKLSEGDLTYIRVRLTAIEYNRPARW